jgi:hypothetical protein
MDLGQERGQVQFWKIGQFYIFTILAIMDLSPFRSSICKVEAGEQPGSDSWRRSQDSRPIPGSGGFSPETAFTELQFSIL